MDILKGLTERAKKNQRRVALPEAEDERVILAAIKLARDGIAKPVLIGNKNDISASLESHRASLDGISIEDPSDSERLAFFAELYLEARPKASNKVAQRLLRNPLFLPR